MRINEKYRAYKLMQSFVFHYREWRKKDNYFESNYGECFLKPNSLIDIEEKLINMGIEPNYLDIVKLLKKQKMKTTILLSLLLTASVTVFGQTKPATTKKDSLKFSDDEVGVLVRNTMIIQQTIHKFDMSSLLRDKLDSVYNQTQAILQDRVKGNRVTKK